MIHSLRELPAVMAYLTRIGAKVRSMRTAVVEMPNGKYWTDVAIIKITDKGEINVSRPGYEPTESEAAQIAEACATVEWPKLKLITRVTDLPEELRNLEPESVFEFRNENDELIMIQKRIETRDGSRAYVPFTFWTDGAWRQMEPDGKLPLWGLNRLRDHTTVFIHEGAGAARYCDWMVTSETRSAKEALDAFPWKDELAAGAHIGWIGGALNPQRTDWKALGRLGVKRAYIVSDNDDAGKRSVPHIAEQLRFTCFHLQFTNEWSKSFDLKDRWPKEMFQSIGDKKFYIGPPFRSVLHPATWATDKFEVKTEKSKKTVITLRDNFKDTWAYIEDADLYVCTEMPEIVRSEAVLNKMLSSFSHSNDTARLLVKAYNGRTAKLCYRPDQSGRLVTNRGNSAINLHVKPDVKPIPGDPEPFLEFMEYMFPVPSERKEMLKWCSTLIAHPEVHMEYGVLLVSEHQGIGKSTLGSILAKLVGDANVSFPSEGDITGSEFNGWLANKRLAVVNEIYSGHSWKAYNKLKGIITDPTVEVNQKFQRTYTIENWCHVFACSNSLRALKMEDDDRRWLYPEVTERSWPREKFVSFYQWLASGGHQIIAHWARQQPEWVLPGQRSPMTLRKKELIEGSRTDAQKEAFDLALAMNNTPEPVALGMKDIENYVRTAVRGRMFDSDYELRKTMKEAGAHPSAERIYVSGRLQYVLTNQVLYEEQLRTEDPKEQLALVVKSVRKATDILPLTI